MLGGDGYSEDSPRVYAGLSDATAVPETETRTDGGWEPAIVINYPVEPSMHDEAVIDSPQPGSTHPGRLTQTRPSTNCPVPTSPDHRIPSESGRSDRRST